MLYDQISLQITIQLRNITLFYILCQRNINLIIFLSKNAEKGQKFNKKLHANNTQLLIFNFSSNLSLYETLLPIPL